MTTNLDESAFQSIAGGETITTSWDIAQVHDLSTGGPISVASSGFIPYAAGNSTVLSPAPLSFASNTLTTTIDGAAAAIVRRSFHSLAQRQVIQSDCTGSKLSATRTALSECQQLAAAASQAASSGPAAKMTEYFKSSSSQTRSTVSSVFARVASECGSSPNGGVSRLYCSDVYQSCSSGVLAYTLPSQSYMVNCNLYYTALSSLSRKCHDQDQATTTLHETTHLSQIAGTTDQGGCYGYNCVQSLSGAQNLKHADTYALFANGEIYCVLAGGRVLLTRFIAIYVGC
jgi:deuterolysin